VLVTFDSSTNTLAACLVLMIALYSGIAVKPARSHIDTYERIGYIEELPYSDTAPLSTLDLPEPRLVLLA